MTIRAISFTQVFFYTFNFSKNNNAQTSELIFPTSRHYYFFEKLKIVEQNLLKLNYALIKSL